MPGTSKEADRNFADLVAPRGTEPTRAHLTELLPSTFDGQCNVLYLFPPIVSTPLVPPTDRPTDRASLDPYIFQDLWPEEARQGKVDGRRRAAGRE